MTNPPHKGWHSRGYLPHLDSPCTYQMLGFRLADSLPAQVWDRLKSPVSPEEERQYFRLLESGLDEGYGSCLLRDSACAAVVAETLIHFHPQRYELIAYVVMPNHVHVLILPADGASLPKILHSWKSYTAKAINLLQHRQGTVWAPDYFDRYIRDEAHFNAAVHYIHENPVKAGLVQSAKEWRWSSAWGGPG